MADEEVVLDGSAEPDGAKKKGPNDRAVPLAKTAEEVKSLVFKVTHKGFSPGSVVAYKGKEGLTDHLGASVVCTIRTIDEAECVIATTSLGEECKTITIKTETLIGDWKLSNERIPVKIDGWSCGWESSRWEWEALQLQAFLNHSFMHCLFE